MKSKSLKPPVIVIGATRSGTSILGHLLGQSSGACFWYEPTTLWRVGHAYRDTDVAREEDASPWVCQWIRGKFERYQEKNGGRRIVEKTPMNTLRVPFVASVFPKAKLIHLVRDGRAVLASRIEQYESFSSHTVTKEGTRNTLARRLKITPWWEWPAYAPRVFRGLFRRYLQGERGVEWFGVRYPGWRHDRKRLDDAEIVAKQWAIACQNAQSKLEGLSSSRWREVRYEEIVKNPRTQFQRIGNFTGLHVDEAFLDRVEDSIHNDSLEKWKERLDSRTMDRAMPHMKDTLSQFDYL